jgi:hypothetical protein
MADWEFELWITDGAGENYAELKGHAEAAVSCFEGGPLPINRDPKLRFRLAAVDHYIRARRILQSIKRPEDVALDKGISGPAHFVRYRTELGTTVYFTRIVTSPPAVLVYALTDSPLDCDAIRKLVLAGKGHMLEQYGLPPLHMAWLN